MGAILDFLSGASAGASARFEDLGWDGTLIVLVSVGLCALAVFGLSRFADFTERRPRTFSSRAMLFVARVVRALIIFVVVYTVTAGVFGTKVPAILLLGLVALALAIAIREAAKKKGRDLWTLLRSWH